MENSMAKIWSKVLVYIGYIKFFNSSNSYNAPSYTYPSYQGWEYRARRI
jgi:hypothetical protein